MLAAQGRSGEVRWERLAWGPWAEAMYGLLLENMADFIKTTYGEDQWDHIRREAMVDMPSFSTHQVYPEALLPRLAKVACKVSLTTSYIR